MITKIENLPRSLQHFHFDGNPITHIDNLPLSWWKHGFNLKHYNIIKRLQRRIRRRHSAAMCIQQGCENWIQKTVTRDGKLGIWVRMGLKDLGYNSLYPPQ